MTKNSAKVFDYITECKNHPTAEDIYFALKEKDRISLATVYNSLNSLLKEEKIAKVNVEDGPDRYDRVWRHDHLVCKCCGKLDDIVLDDLSELLSQKLKQQILSYDLKINYICPECQKGEQDVKTM